MGYVQVVRLVGLRFFLATAFSLLFPAKAHSAPHCFAECIRACQWSCCAFSSLESAYSSCQGSAFKGRCPYDSHLSTDRWFIGQRLSMAHGDAGAAGPIWLTTRSVQESDVAPMVGTYTESANLQTGGRAAPGLLLQKHDRKDPSPVRISGQELIGGTRGRPPQTVQPGTKYKFYK